MEANRDTTTILVVDDNPDNRALAQATLEDEGYRVLLASSGAEAIAFVEAESPDCVLLDVRMPAMSGFEVCERIRKLENGTHLPIVFLTALRDVDTFDAALRAGGDDFLTKPVSPTELVLRVNAALKLQRMSAELRESYDLLRRQRDDLLRVQLQKERLTAFVVHDLKNPISAMDLNAQIILRTPNVSDAVRHAAEEVRQEARAMLRLCLNLLDISKSEEGQLSPRIARVAVARLLTEVVDALGSLARAHEVELRQRAEVETLSADPDLLRRVLENLLDNAIRHAPERSVVELVARHEEAHWVLSVADQGKGVAPEMREKIFERYARGEAAQDVAARTGRGLGLSFCKLAVEAHGGTIAVEDARPGAKFCVRIPDGER